jgi:hypothetical protein
MVTPQDVRRAMLVAFACAVISGCASAAAKVKPSDTACPAECTTPARRQPQGTIWCTAVPACTNCPVPAGAPPNSRCSCHLWSRAVSPQPVPPNFDPDWKHEAKQMAPVQEDTSRRYSCQCGY